MKKGAYGVVYQDVTRNGNLSAAAKGLYAYLSSFCGVSDECYPGVDMIIQEMRMGKDTYYRHINALVAAGVVEKRQTAGEGGKFGRTIYRLTHEVVISDFPFPQNEDTDYPTTVSRETNNNNNININKKENIKEKIDYQQIADLYNDTCVSLPRLTKLSDSRKKTIRARLNTYSLEDFKKLFEMAEGSSFLKGKNDRDWSANFDWLIKDANMAKVLDGNYADYRHDMKGELLEEPKTKDPGQFSVEERKYSKSKEEIEAEIYKIAHTYISQEAFKRYHDKIHELIRLCCPLEDFTREQVYYMFSEWGCEPRPKIDSLISPAEDNYDFWDTRLEIK